MRGGIFRLVTRDGTPVPAGAIVRFMGANFPVTYDGVTYVTGFDHGTAGTAQWDGARCSFRLDAAATRRSAAGHGHGELCSPA